MPFTAPKQDLFEAHGLTFSAGAAVHIGKVAYGGMSQSETTLVGDPVNLTFRIEALTRALGVHTLVSQEFLEGWPEGQAFCRPMGHQQVKGRVQPVDVSSLEVFPQ